MYNFFVKCLDTIFIVNWCYINKHELNLQLTSLQYFLVFFFKRFKLYRY